MARGIEADTVFMDKIHTQQCCDTYGEQYPDEIEKMVKGPTAIMEVERCHPCSS
jgi:hypothetical protein